MKLASNLRTDWQAFESVINSYLQSYEETRTPRLYVYIPDVVTYGSFNYTTNTPLSSLREIEKEIIAVGEADNVAVFDLRQNTRLQAILSILTTIFVVFVLGAGTLILSRVTQEMVITPIEEMMTKVKRISENRSVEGRGLI